MTYLYDYIANIMTLFANILETTKSKISYYLSYKAIYRNDINNKDTLMSFKYN